MRRRGRLVRSSSLVRVRFQEKERDGAHPGVLGAVVKVIRELIRACWPFPSLKDIAIGERTEAYELEEYSNEPRRAEQHERELKQEVRRALADSEEEAERRAREGIDAEREAEAREELQKYLDELRRDGYTPAIRRDNSNAGGPIDDLTVDARIRRSLKAAGISSIAHVASMTEDEIIAVKGIGQKSLAAIRSALDSLDET